MKKNLFLFIIFILCISTTRSVNVGAHLKLYSGVNYSYLTESKSELIKPSSDDGASVDSKNKDSEIYDKVRNTIDDQLQQALDIENDKDVKQSEDKFWTAYMNLYNMYKSYVPLAIIVIISFGVMLVLFSRKNNGIRKWAIITFCISLPLIIIALVYGVPYIHAIF